MNFKVVAIDETAYWLPHIAKKCGQIFGLYVYDADHSVHLCELTPSHELILVHSVAMRDIDETTQQDLRDGDAQCEQLVYRHAHTLPGMRYQTQVNVSLDDDLDYEERMDAVVEYLQCNAGNEHSLGLPYSYSPALN